MKVIKIITNYIKKNKMKLKIQYPIEYKLNYLIMIK